MSNLVKMHKNLHKGVDSSLQIHKKCCITLKTLFLVCQYDIIIT